MKTYKKLSNIGSVELAKYIRNEKQAKEILIRHGVLNISKNCPICKKEMKFYNGSREYFYCSKKCNMIIGFKHNTILQDMRIKYKTFILFCYYFFYRETMTKGLMRNLNISRKTIMELKKRIENKIILFNKKMTKLGGDQKVVEADESLIATAKYGYGYFPEQTWVFGVVERESGKCCIKVVPDRKRKTLEEILKAIVVSSTLIVTDQANAYNKLSDIGFKHFTVCHKRNFVDPDTGAHTQTIESLWNHFKKKKHQEYGITKSRLENYCEVFCFFRNNKDMSFEEFLKILK
ncbi:hypothetical protein DMUE_5915 [Dictyocoela muelleri]|nr:hypothetical protein DMUE_5915 [Dictyocoela muelleri]